MATRKLAVGLVSTVLALSGCTANESPDTSVGRAAGTGSHDTPSPSVDPTPEPTPTPAQTPAPPPSRPPEITDPPKFVAPFDWQLKDPLPDEACALPLGKQVTYFSRAEVRAALQGEWILCSVKSVG